MLVRMWFLLYTLILLWLSVLILVFRLINLAMQVRHRIFRRRVHLFSSAVVPDESLKFLEATHYMDALSSIQTGRLQYPHVLASEMAQRHYKVLLPLLLVWRLPVLKETLLLSHVLVAVFGYKIHTSLINQLLK